MAHTRSAKKRIRQNEKRRLRNKAQMSALRTQIKKFRTALEAGDLERARTEYQATARALDKAVTKGIIHRNNADRRKSRLARELAKMADAAQAGTAAS